MGFSVPAHILNSLRSDSKMWKSKFKKQEARCKIQEEPRFREQEARFVITRNPAPLSLLLHFHSSDGAGTAGENAKGQRADVSVTDRTSKKKLLLYIFFSGDGVRV